MRDWDKLVERAVRVTEKAFGRTVTLRYGGAVAPGDPIPSVTLHAVFDEAYRSEDASGGVPVSTTYPICDVRLSDVPWEPEEGDQVETGSDTYTVTATEPDGAGTVRLILRRGALQRW